MGVIFAALAAAIAAELRRDKDLLDSVKEEHSVQRQVIIADITILATAIAYKASKLVAEDGHMSKLAQGRILVQPLDRCLCEDEPP